MDPLFASMQRSCRRDSARSRIQRLPAPDEHEAVESHIQEGRAHEERGEVDGAILRYEEASAADPFDPRPLDALEAISEAHGDRDLIAELLGRRILICPTPRERRR